MRLFSLSHSTDQSPTALFRRSAEHPIKNKHTNVLDQSIIRPRQRRFAEPKTQRIHDDLQLPIRLPCESGNFPRDIFYEKLADSILPLAREPNFGAKVL